MITSLEEAKKILEYSADFMIAMEMNDTYWIVEGVRGSDGILVADGDHINQISEEVFNTLAKDMEQENCSEFFQKRVQGESSVR